jgi:hypothetical protein
MTKKLGRLIGIICACVAFTGVANAYTFTSQGYFTAEFPSAPILEKTKDAESDSSMWSVTDEQTIFAVSVLVLSKPKTYDYDTGAQGAAAGAGGTLRSQKAINQSGVNGREILIDIPNAAMARQRIFFIYNKLYTVFYFCQPCTEISPNGETFLNSFRILK